jgi:hypothetical protein
MKPWTQQERSELKELLARGATANEIALKLNRTVGGVHQQSYKLRHGLFTGTVKPWDEEELKLLRKMCNSGSTVSQVAAAIPHRTRYAVNSKVHQQRGLSDKRIDPPTRNCWSPQEDQLVDQLYRVQKLTAMEISKRINKTVGATYNRIHRLVRGLQGHATKRHNPHGPWSNDDCELLQRLHASDISLENIRSQLNVPRSIAAIRAQLWRLAEKGLTTSPSSQCVTQWTSEEDKRLLDIRHSTLAPWTTIKPLFPGRTVMALQSRWAILSRRRAQADRLQTGQHEVKA